MVVAVVAEAALCDHCSLVEGTTLRLKKRLLQVQDGASISSLHIGIGWLR